MGIAREPGDPTQKASRALFRIDKRILWLRAGEELEFGLVLQAIDADAVRILRDGKETRLALRERSPPEQCALCPSRRLRRLWRRRLPRRSLPTAAN